MIYLQGSGDGSVNVLHRNGEGFKYGQSSIVPPSCSGNSLSRLVGPDDETQDFVLGYSYIRSVCFRKKQKSQVVSSVNGSRLVVKYPWPFV